MLRNYTPAFNVKLDKIMAITDLQISEELQTGAPSIKYRGNEGPQAPMQMADADPLLVEEYEKYVFEMQEQGLQPMTFDEFKRQAIAGYAYGGIAGLDGRKRYGIGSKLKRAVRKIIPNEVARVAEVAAPFVAPFNPLIGGAMAGLGGFDRHGSLGKGLRSGLMTYGLGNVARYAGGAGPQWGLKAPEAGTGFGSYFTKPVGAETGIGKMLSDKKTPTNIDAMSGGEYGEIYKEPVFGAGDALGGEMQTVGVEAAEETAKKNFVTQTVNNIKKAKLSTKAMMGIVGASGLAGLYTAMTQPEEELETLDRGVGLPGGISGIRTEVIEAMKDPSGEKLKALRVKYPFLGEQETKNIDIMAQGGRAGYYAGGQSIPSEYTMEDARKTAMQDKLGGITEVMKQADLYRQGDVGQMYMAEGGGTGSRNRMSELMFKLANGTITEEEIIELRNIESSSVFSKGKAQGGRIGAQEGGIMDLGGMEKDYRETGGFVDLGAEEKADDVPARLSVNEFVMTADAVRGAGDGDIDKGAERMEDLMEKLEAKNRRQQGASDMFEVSERLSEVV
jgi:hypothetical protein